MSFDGEDTPQDDEPRKHRLSCIAHMLYPLLGLHCDGGVGRSLSPRPHRPLTLFLSSRRARRSRKREMKFDRSEERLYSLRLPHTSIPRIYSPTFCLSIYLPSIRSILTCLRGVSLARYTGAGLSRFFHVYLCISCIMDVHTHIHIDILSLEYSKMALVQRVVRVSGTSLIANGCVFAPAIGHPCFLSSSLRLGIRTRACPYKSPHTVTR